MLNIPRKLAARGLATVLPIRIASAVVEQCWAGSDTASQASCHNSNGQPSRGYGFSREGASASLLQSSLSSWTAAACPGLHGLGITIGQSRRLHTDFASCDSKRESEASGNIYSYVERAIYEVYRYARLTKHLSALQTASQS